MRAICTHFDKLIKMKTPLLLLWLTLCCSLLLAGSAPSAAATASLPSTPAAAAAGVDVFVAGEAGYYCIKIPNLIAFGNGRLVALAEARNGSCSDYAPTSLVTKRSVDGGLSWTPLQVVHAEPGHVIGNAAPVLLRSTGRLLVPFCRDNLEVYQTYSDDGGVTWALPVPVSNATKQEWRWIGLGPPSAIQLQSGRVIVPSYHDTSPHWEDGTLTHVHLLLSDDEGVNWRIGASIDADGEGDDYSNECSAVELVGQPNAVLVNARTLASHRVQLLSLDGGSTFSGAPQLKHDLPQPLDGCEGAMVQLPNGTLLLSNPAALTLRFNLTLHASHDQGASWLPIAVIDEQPSAYSALAVWPNTSGGKLTTVGLLYERAPPPPQIVFVPTAITYRNLTL